ncbi:MAG: glutamate racemase [Erysipelotrichaceae bacterium]|nr:glutamate racemase [Erysipelotrichaceae bacterium]
MKRIGVFDSGLGGLTVVKAILSEMPKENIVFFADAANMPYGDKTPEEIIAFSKHNASLLNEYDLKAMVIACNTSDSIAGDLLKQSYDIPVSGVIKAAAKEAVRQTGNRKIAVLATKATVSSGSYQKQIAELDKEIEVTAIPCPDLVPLIEEGRFATKDELLDQSIETYLEKVRRSGADTVILGCTHYDLIYDLVQEKMPDVRIVSSSRTLVQELKEILTGSHRLSRRKGKDIYLSSSCSERLDQIAAKIIPDIRLQKK